MATEYRIYDIPGGLAGEDFSATGGLLGNDGSGAVSGQYLFVAGVIGTDDTYVHYKNDNITSGLIPVGVSQNNPVLGDGLAVRALGRTKITLGATVLSGQEVGSDANGRAVVKNATTTGANLGDFVMGVCTHGGAVGEIGQMELIGRYRV
jgi:hypothetical protein